MILSYRDKRTQAFAEGQSAREFQSFARQAYRRLEVLDAATSLDELRALRSNRLEALKGDRAGQYSIRVNMQWRICFDWTRGALGPSMSRSSIITEEMMTMRPAIHPGEILADELEEISVTPTELARQLRVPANRITQIVQGKRSITGDTALRLGHWFGMSAQFWLNLQSAYDIRVAGQTAGAEIARLPKRQAAR
jgi:addiction module HigA family antidote